MRKGSRTVVTDPLVPAVGALLVDMGHADRVGEFRGLAGSHWSLRPIRGGVEWEADPQRVRPADAIERLSARTALANRQSRGEAL
ncbi:hypothetical protein ACIQM0_23185 [Streptomyces sp. NPDC091387]|uniref:hypothetical protein n=1 Tax=unclassified Streptomyces TaxID=2593676 RepID=UPI0038195C71